MMSRRQMLMMDSLKEYTVTGNPVSFNTNVSKPLSQVLIPFTPVQSGTGDPSPSNVRPITGWTGVNVSHCGRNMYSFDASKIETVQNTYGYDRSAYRLGFRNCTLTFSAVPKTAGVRTQSAINITRLINNVAQTGASAFLTDATENTVTYTVGDGEEIVLLQAKNQNTEMATNLQLYDIQIEVGSSESAYVPYSGTTIPVTFPAMGKNLFNDNDPVIQYGKFINSSYEVTDNTRGCISNVIKIKPDTYYAFSRLNAPASAYMAQYDEDGNPVARASIAIGTNASATIKSNASADYCVITLQCASGTTMSSSVLQSYRIQMEEGNSATSYEPYTNTAYGGTLDVTTGVLTVEYIKYDADYLATKTVSDLSGLQENVYGYRFNMSKSEEYAIDTEISQSKCSCLKRGIDGAGGYAFSYRLSGHYRIVEVAVYSETPLSTKQDLCDYLKSIGFELVYVIEPIEYQLTPQQIQTLIGDNVIFSDTNGENTIKYLKKG